MPTDPAIRLRQGESITLYDKKKRIYCRFRLTNGSFYRMDGSRDRSYWETWPARLELQDCINIIKEIQEHNREIDHPGQVEIQLNNQ